MWKHWFSNPFKKSALQLFKEKEDKALIESIKRIVVDCSGGGMRYIGISEYGARKHIEEGTEPVRGFDKVLISAGELISWDEWKMINIGEDV